MPVIRNLTKTRLSLPLAGGTVMVLPGGKAHVPRVCQAVMRAVENGSVEVVGAKREKLAFPINDLAMHEAIAAVETVGDVDLLNSLLAEARSKGVREAIKRRLRLLGEENADDNQ